MTRITLNVIVHNEEARLEACLRDARPWVDEIVVVDQSSTDGTAEIARRLADVYLVDAHHGYCEASRELAAQRSAGDWILVLDADERLSDRFKRSVRDLTTHGRDGYRLVRELFLDGRSEGRGFGEYRLFRRDCVRFLNELHTEPQPVTANIERLDYVSIIHHKTMEEQLVDERRYEAIISSSDLSLDMRHAKLALNVHLNTSLKALKVRGPFKGPSGYDHHVREYVRELHAQDVAIELVDIPEWSSVELPAPLRDSWFDSLDKPTNARTVLHFCLPHQVRSEPGMINVNYTMFEASRVHPSWVLDNRTDDLVVVPTESSRQAWVNSGMPEERICICPLGINPVLYSRAASPLPLRMTGGESLGQYRVRFLNVSELGPRKNLIGLLRVWLQATSHQDDAALIIKLGCYASGWHQLFEHQIEMVQQQLGKRLEEAAPVHFIYDLFSDEDMPRLYATATHYISMSFGEGWDQAMVEAAASGLKLIAPDHSAYRAYLDSSVASLISTREVPADFGSGDPDTAALFEYGNWWQPDEDEAVACIQRAIAGTDRANSLLRDRILAELNWARATRRLIAILADLEARHGQAQLWTPFPRHARA